MDMTLEQLNTTTDIAPVGKTAADIIPLNFQKAFNSMTVADQEAVTKLAESIDVTKTLCLMVRRF